MHVRPEVDVADLNDFESVKYFGQARKFDLHPLNSIGARFDQEAIN